MCRWSCILTGEGGGGVGGTKSYEGEKAWSSLNHSILPGIGILCIVEGLTCFCKVGHAVDIVQLFSLFSYMVKSVGPSRQKICRQTKPINFKIYVGFLKKC